MLHAHASGGSWCKLEDENQQRWPLPEAATSYTNNKGEETQTVWISGQAWWRTGPQPGAVGSDKRDVKQRATDVLKQDRGLESTEELKTAIKERQEWRKRIRLERADARPRWGGDIYIYTEEISEIWIHWFVYQKTSSLLYALHFTFITPIPSSMLHETYSFFIKNEKSFAKQMISFNIYLDFYPK